jgi:actin-related protein
MANNMKQVLLGNFDVPINKRERASYKEDDHERQLQLFKQKSTHENADYNPISEPSFKKKGAHEDDEIYNKREK